MIKRLVLKGVLITSGVLLLIFTIISLIFFKYNKIDTEKKYDVLISTKDINEGDTLNETLLSYKTIKESALTEYMLLKKEDALNMTATTKIRKNDYISTYNIVYKTSDDKDKIIVLPMDVDTRLANLIVKNSLVDIKVEQKNKIPQVVISKITVKDILDENGISINSDAIGVKKCYAKFILNDDQRDKLYVARSIGKLIYELYIDKVQKSVPELFVIPKEFVD